MKSVFTIASTAGLLGLGILFAGCSSVDSAKAVDNNSAVLEDARKVAAAVPARLLGVLTEEIGKNGALAAVEVCNTKAPQMAKNASEQTGWAIKRVSLRNRNPKAVPDAWERAALEEFDRRAAAGESPATLEKSTVVEQDGKKEFRYVKALPAQAMCLGCHGTADKIPADVAAKIKALYPEDKATGYAAGHIRGAITLRKPVL